MAIRSILSSVYKNCDKFYAPSGKTSDTTKKEKVKNSEMGKTLQNTGDIKNLAEIQKKVKSGFYNSEVVISKVADAILKEIGK